MHGFKIFLLVTLFVCAVMSNYHVSILKYLTNSYHGIRLAEITQRHAGWQKFIKVVN